MNSFTSTNPLSVNLTPASATPELAKFGFLPVQSSTTSASKDLPLFKLSFTMSSLTSKLSVATLHITFILSFLNCLPRAFAASESILPKICGRTSIIVTLVPSEE